MTTKPEEPIRVEKIYVRRRGETSRYSVLMWHHLLGTEEELNKLIAANPQAPLEEARAEDWLSGVAVRP